MKSAYLACIAGLEKDNLSVSRQSELVEQAAQEAEMPAPKLPVWLAGAECRRAEDLEDLINKLPKITVEWYNKDDIQISVLSPDIVLSRMAAESVHGNGGAASFYHLKSDGSLDTEGAFCGAVLLLCPERCTSRQLAGIASRLTPDTIVMTLSYERTEDLAAAVRQADLKQLDFLTARWEIEQEPKEKSSRLAELLAHLKAIAGGEAHGA